MNTWGSFESVKEIAQSGLGFLWSARPKNAVVEGETYIIKTTEGLSLLGDPERLERESILFLQAADAQAKVVAAGAKRWARLHEFGKTDAGAFYVADMYVRSAQKIIARGIRLDARALSTVAHAVIDGLIELRDTLNRPHGNLKPSNVLVGGPDGPTIDDAPVVLSDPKPATTLSPSDAANDLNALGRLLYELVMLRPLRDRVNLTVSISDEWSRLGPSSLAWIDLTNALLAAGNGQPVPDLQSVRAMIPSAAMVAPRRSKAKLAAGLVAAFIAIGGGVYITTRPRVVPVVVPPPPPLQLSELDLLWSDFVLDWQWFQPAQRAELAGLLRDAASAGRDVPQSLLDALPAAGEFMTPEEAAGATGRSVTLDELRAIKPTAHRETLNEKARAKWLDDLSASVRAVTAAREQLLRFLEPSALLKLRDAWKQRGWTNAADNLAAAIDTAEKFAPTTRKGNLLPKPVLISEAAAAVIDAQRAQTVLDRVEALRAQLETTPEPALADLAGLVSREGAAATQAASPQLAAAKLAETLVGLEASLKQASTLLAAKDRDLASFRAAPAYTPASPLSAQSLAAWNKALASDEFQVLDANGLKPIEDRRGQLAARVAKLSADLDKALKRANPKFAQDNPPETLRTKLADLKADIAAAGTGLVLSKASKPKLDAAFEAIDKRIAALDDRNIIPRGYAETPAELRVLATKSTFAHRAIQDRWIKAAEAVASGPAETFIDRTDVFIEQLAPALREVTDAKFFPPPTAPDAGFDLAQLTRLAAEQRDAALTRFAALDDAKIIDPASRTALSETYTQWKSAVETRLLAAAQAANQLALAHLPGGTEIDPAKTFAPAAADPQLAPVVKPVKDRLDALDALAKETNPEKLLESSERASPDRAAERLIAWRRLAALPWTPADVPVGAARFDRTLKALTAAHASLDASGLAEPRKQAVAKDLRAAGLELWKKHTAWSLTIPDEPVRKQAFTASWTAAAPLGATVADADAISTVAGYNWRALEAQAALAKISASASPTDQAALIQALFTMVEDYAKSASLAARPDVAPFLRIFKLGTTPEAGKSFSAAETGPTSAPIGLRMKWAADEVDDAVIYAAGSHVLVFLPVTVGDGEVLMSTHEVTAALVRDVLRSAKIDPDASWSTDPAQSLLTLPTTDLDSRAGPRVWSTTDGRTISTSARARIEREWFGWLAGNATLDAPPRTFRWLPENTNLPQPSLDMPMQQLSPEAALLVARHLGCRLPTAEEWQAARASSWADPAVNLRDQSWKTARDMYAAQIDGWNKDPAHANNLITAQYPSGGIFLPAGKAASFSPVSDAEATADNDGAIFFKSAKSDSSARKLADLSGNVAEFVLTESAEVEKLGKDCSVDDVFGYFAGTTKQPNYAALRVVGGSAISPPAGPFAYDINTPQPVDITARVGFSDVGFRLAIPKEAGPTGTPVERAAKAFEKRLKILGQ